MEDFRSVSGVGGEDGQGFGLGKMEEEIGSVLWGQEVKVWGSSWEQITVQSRGWDARWLIWRFSGWGRRYPPWGYLRLLGHTSHTNTHMIAVVVIARMLSQQLLSCVYLYGMCGRID
jgi:hypothetical protein